jgi:hypothetical protein
VTPAQAGPYVGDPSMLAHILAGMQDVLGDLQADDSPRTPHSRNREGEHVSQRSC